MTVDYITVDYILIESDTKEYRSWGNAAEVPPSCEGLEWVEWGKELPEDIDSKEYTLSSLEDWYKDNFS